MFTVALCPRHAWCPRILWSILLKVISMLLPGRERELVVILLLHIFPGNPVSAQLLKLSFATNSWPSGGSLGWFSLPSPPPGLYLSITGLNAKSPYHPLTGFLASRILCYHIQGWFLCPWGGGDFFLSTLMFLKERLNTCVQSTRFEQEENFNRNIQWYSRL